MKSTIKGNNEQESIHTKYKKMADEAIALKIFDIIEQNPRTSQHQITVHSGLTTGLVHSFMKRIINKGWVHAKQVNAKRWLYFMTPEGFVEKSRLTMNYLSRTLSVYRSTHNTIQEQLNICYENRWLRLVVAGGNELAEITALNIKAVLELTLVAIVADTKGQKIIAGETVLPFSSINQLDYHKIIVCDPNFISWSMGKGELLKSSNMINLLIFREPT